MAPSKLFIVSTLSLCVALSACRKKDTMAPIVLGEDNSPSALDGSEQFGPPWRESAIQTLPNQSQLVWLAEPERERMDLRVMIPLPGAQDTPLSAASIEIVLSVLEKQLRYRARTASLRFSRHDRPGRCEFALHGRADQLRHALFLISSGFAAAPNTSLLSETQGEFVAAWVDNPVDHATRDQIATLLNLEPNALYGESPDFARLRAKDLAKAWNTLTAPQRCTVVIHSHAPTPDDQRSLAALSEQWDNAGKTNVKGSKSALDRLFAPAKATPALPLAQQSLRQTPIIPTKSPLLSPTGRITWLVSRRLDLPDAKSRAFARLAQRTLQHQFDVRLVIHNRTGLWQIRKDLSPEPELAAQELRHYLGDLDQALHERLVPGRAHQAARTWLGARLVQNSLEGEDWTALWSQALDLSSDPRELPFALQKNGLSMMQADMKAFESWMQSTIDPSLARGPWISQLIFASDAALAALNKARTEAPEKD